MKKLIALILVVALAATALTTTAFAYSDFEDGFYKGKAYTMHLTATDSSGSTSVSWAGDGVVSRSLVVNTQHRITGLTGSVGGTDTHMQHASVSKTVSSGYFATSGTSYCSITNSFYRTLFAYPGS